MKKTHAPDSLTVLSLCIALLTHGETVPQGMVGCNSTRNIGVLPKTPEKVHSMDLQPGVEAVSHLHHMAPAETCA